MFDISDKQKLVCYGPWIIYKVFIHNLTWIFSQTRTHVIPVALKKEDEVQNYCLHFLQFYMVHMHLKDAIKEGDICRISNSLKSWHCFLHISKLKLLHRNIRLHPQD